MMEHDMSVAPGRTHKYFTGTPVVEFGAGLSYTSFTLAISHMDPGGVANGESSRRGDSIITIQTNSSSGVNVTVAVTNTGSMDGDIVLLVYLIPIHLPTQLGSKLLQKLWQFQRIADVAVGATASAQFTVDAEAISLTDLATGDLVSAPGTYKLVVKDGTSIVTLDLEVCGDQTVLEPFPKA
jgi:hypothetical protein